MNFYHRSIIAITQTLRFNISLSFLSINIWYECGSEKVLFIRHEIHQNWVLRQSYYVRYYTCCGSRLNIITDTVSFVHKYLNMTLHSIGHVVSHQLENITTKISYSNWNIWRRYNNIKLQHDFTLDFWQIWANLLDRSLCVELWIQRVSGSRFKQLNSLKKFTS